MGIGGMLRAGRLTTSYLLINGVLITLGTFVPCSAAPTGVARQVQTWRNCCEYYFVTGLHRARNQAIQVPRPPSVRLLIGPLDLGELTEIGNEELEPLYVCGATDQG